MSPLAFFADFKGLKDALPAASPSSLPNPAPAQERAAVASVEPHGGMFIDPKPALGAETLTFADNAPLQAIFRSPSVQREASLEQPVAPVPPETPPLPSPAPPTALAVQPPSPPIPLPVPRPAEFRLQRPPEAPKLASIPAAAPAEIKSAALPGAPTDNRSFIEKLFGVRPASTPSAALSYAALENNTGGLAPGSRLSPAPNPGVGAGTAVYDISAQVVTLPNGERLEAHSGLGDKLDDPHYVHVPMRGATPPGTYELTEREQLFHGVRALRLNPVGGSSAIYGRVGLLAHTFMLGPNGDSNGCVSFRNYDRFLQAYLRGEVRRLVVVTGRGDALPSIVNRRGGSQRYAQSASNT